MFISMLNTHFVIMDTPHPVSECENEGDFGEIWDLRVRGELCCRKRCINGRGVLCSVFSRWREEFDTLREHGTEVTQTVACAMMTDFGNINSSRANLPY